MSLAGANPSKAVVSAHPPMWWAAPGFLAFAGLSIVALIALTRHWFLAQNRISWGSDDWAHAYLVPFISGYAVWRVRDRLARLTPEIFWPGLAPLIAGIACYFLFTLGFPTHMGGGYAIVLTIFGLCLFNLGPRITALLAFPILYLAFAVTPSNFLIKQFMFQLQLIASDGAWMLLNMVGIHTEVAGNTLTIMRSTGETIPLNVAEACSGMRMVIAFYALGTAIAFISTRQWWQRIALLLLAAPIAIFVNVLRVASIGALSLWDTEFAKGNTHMLVGVIWLIPAFALFLGCVWALRRAVVNPETDGAEA